MKTLAIIWAACISTALLLGVQLGTCRHGANSPRYDIASTDRIPLVEVSGITEQLPAGDNINIGSGAYINSGANSFTGASTFTGVTTFTGDVAEQLVSWAPSQITSTLTLGVQYDNWSPTGWGTHSLIVVSAGDNYGNLITGLDSTGIAVGDTRTICNIDTPADDGVLVFSNEDSNSTAANRIETPGSNAMHLTQRADRYTLSPQACLTLVYGQPKFNTDLTVHRWLIVSPGTHQYRAIVQSLQLFPDNTPTNLTSGNTVNDYAPVDTCPQVPGASGGSCEAGGSTAFRDYTVVNLFTSAAGAATIGGLQFDDTSYSSNAGPVKLLVNYGPGNVILLNLGAGNSNVQDKIQWPANVDVTMAVGDTVLLWHGTHTNYWHPIGRYTVGSCSAGNAITGVNADGTLTCSAFVTSGTLTANRVVKASAAGAIANSAVVDDGATWNLNSSKVTMDESTGDIVGARDITGGRLLWSPQMLVNTRLVPTALTSSSTTTSWAPASLHTIETVAITTSGAGTATLASMEAGNDGEQKRLCNYGAGFVKITHEGAGTAAFWTPGGVPYFLPSVSSATGGCVDVHYMAANARWVIVASPPSQRGNHRCSWDVAPSANHGTLSTGSTDCSGSVTGVGAFTSVTLTAGDTGYAGSFCVATPNGHSVAAELLEVTQSATAPVVNCYAVLTAAAANCDDFTYWCEFR